ncbi:TonB family protein [bacterium]|nr:TonB family protein [bacterium]
MKKNRFLLIALAVSILLHALAFVFVPELKSEINPSDYLKKITKISIFRDDMTTERRDETKRDDVTTKRRNETKRDDVTTKRRNKTKRDDVTPEQRDETKRDAVTPERRDETKRDAVTPGRRDETKRDAVTTGRRDETNRNDGTTERRDDSGTPKTAGELAVIPKAINPKTPDYPEVLEDEGVEGNVTLELLISKEGKVLKAKVIKSDHELFSESALKVVKNYKFSPGKLADGSAADSLIEFVIKFEISL